MPEQHQITIAEVMRAYAADAVGYAKRQYGIDLDYSEASLEHIDRMLVDRMQGEVIEPEKLTTLEQEDLWIYCKMLGGYVGEVVIRNLGGTWQLKEADSGASSVKLMAAGKIEMSPPGSVWRTLTEPYRSMVSYYRSLRAILSHGQERMEGGVKVLKLPPLSGRSPGGTRHRKPWWRFW